MHGCAAMVSVKNQGIRESLFPDLNQFPQPKLQGELLSPRTHSFGERSREIWRLSNTLGLKTMMLLLDKERRSSG